MLSLSGLSQLGGAGLWPAYQAPAPASPAGYAAQVPTTAPVAGTGAQMGYTGPLNSRAPLVAFVMLVAALAFTRIAYELAQESPGAS